MSFASAETAGHNVSGLPAAARALREAALAGVQVCWLRAGGYGWAPSPSTRAEMLRAAGAMEVRGLDAADDCPPADDGPVLVIVGEALVEAAAIRATLARGSPAHPALVLAETGDNLPAVAASEGRAALDAAGRAILAATGKAGDGIVSRNLNRPISRRISAAMLRLPWVRPDHVTFATALLGVAMFACLAFLAGRAGLVAGAVLFQVASVIDGVDGEIARATFRSTARGALFDSLVDAATNLGFVAGVVIHVYRAGDLTSAAIGGAGLGLLALGLTVIGHRSRIEGGPFSFDALKDRYRRKDAPWLNLLVWLTMRDFAALLAVALVVLGQTPAMVTIFAVIVAGWLAVVLATPARVTV
ncbi:MAG: CDP-alcohol phosphatidyltransferase family protein [Novosphingobium sp.]|nr:CDP-alcohol phosphatidyltransferase family protein [Novosphingobium sp.]